MRKEFSLIQLVYMSSTHEISRRKQPGSNGNEGQRDGLRANFKNLAPLMTEFLNFYFLCLQEDFVDRFSPQQRSEITNWMQEAYPLIEHNAVTMQNFRTIYDHYTKALFSFPLVAEIVKSRLPEKDREQIFGENPIESLR